MAREVRNLVKRGDTWYVRVQVPADVQGKIGTRELWETLQTPDLFEAKKLRRPVVARFDLPR